MTIVIKAIILTLFFFIIFSLGSALYFLIHDKHESTRIITALTWRIGLSMVLFVLLIVAYYLGWIEPHPVVGWR